ncbi:MAG TPA: hypothetical protein VED37_18850 [Ktedonobacteraceae bacterium]|nr:hypothetical protein [Ktedonobacteraceae bacterium]
MNNDAIVGPEVRMRDNMRGARYGEIFVITGHLNHIRGSVYNTLGLNDCPQEQWHYRVRTLDQDYVMQATGEVQVIQDDLENTYQRATS